MKGIWSVLNNTDNLEPELRIKWRHHMEHFLYYKLFQPEQVVERAI